MSLIGSLEDLGLGDILQIVTLSRKSGLLLLRSEQGEGRLVFRDGLVRGAFVKGESEDLRGLVVAGGLLDASAYDRARATAEESGTSVADEIASGPDLSRERLDALCQEHVERVALRMFRWRTGEFSFEVRDGDDERDEDLLLPTGINSQYLIMEATRLGDEGDRDGEAPESGSAAGPSDDLEDERLVFSGEDPPTQELPAMELPPAGEILDFDAPAAPDPSGLRPPTEATDTLALATAARVAGTLEGDPPEPAEVWLDQPLAAPEDGEPARTAEAEAPVGDAEEVAVVTESEIAPPAPAPERRASRLVLIDPDLPALEWLKAGLKDVFQRVHIFQRPEAGVARIRQYLGRGELPAVAVAAGLPTDPLTGAEGSRELILRLRAQAPRMPIFAIVPEGPRGVQPASFAGADAVLTRPPAHQLARRRTRDQLASAAEALRQGMLPHLVGGSAAAPRAGSSPDPLRRLRRISHRLRDASARGDVLSLVLEFAAESFPRVAMFMVRDDVAVGMAQMGLPRGGGPDDDDFRRLELPAATPAAFRRVIDTHRAVRSAPTDEGDRELMRLLGSDPPREAYVAPIESSGRIVALLYADHLPEARAIGDTEVLEIVLHEAGLALERAVLERALAESRKGH